MHATASTSPGLSRCLYVSRSSYFEEAGGAAAAIDDILQVSRTMNPSRAITGGLMHTGGYFFQVIEGPREAVTMLMAAINADARHRDVTPLLFETTTTRQFGSWTMGFADLPSAETLLNPLFASPDDEHAQMVASLLLHVLKGDTPEAVAGAC